MTDDGRFLSRRERRAQEEREAANAPADTDALALGPISESIPTHTPDGRLLTRRERRRLERARQPMETWTAEEEMIATGQIPAMTPERIAEQEKLARERAAAAQREAQEASEELEGLVDHPAVAQSAAEPQAEPHAERPTEPAAQPQWEPAPSEDTAAPAEAEPQQPWSPSEPAAQGQDSAVSGDSESQDQPAGEDDQPPARTSLIAAVAADVNSDVSQEQEPTTEPSAQDQAVSAPSASPSFESAPPAFEPQSNAPDPEMPATFGSAPSAPEPALPTSEAPVESPPSTPSASDEDAQDTAPPVPAIPGMPPGMTPEMFAELFPPGSLQRRMMEDQAASEANTEAEPEDPAAEIRRLTQEAVAGLGGSEDQPSEDPAPSAQTPAPWESPAQEPQAPWEVPAHEPQAQWQAPASQSAPEELSQQSSPSAPSAPTPDNGPPTFSIPTLDSDAPSEPTQPEPTWPSAADSQSAPGVESAPAASSAPQAPVPLDQAPFDAILGDHPDSAALDQASHTPGGYGSPNFSGVGTEPEHQVDQQHQVDQEPQEVHGFAPAPGASAPWGEHPLSQVDREAPELPEMPPAQSVPQPDLSGVGFRPTTGEQGPVPVVEPVPTGQIEVPPRERPELSGADVPRHFKWAHLAVFGAVGLLLGVVVWQVV